MIKSEVKVKAWRYYDRRKLHLEEAPIPVPKAGEVLIKVTSCGICQTDVDEFMGGPKLFNKLPFIPGHEFGGIIVDVGPGVTKEKIGKIVTVAPLISCGQCKFCKAERQSLCDQLGYYGMIGYDGGFAEYAVVKAENAIEVNTPEIVHFGEILLVALRVLHLIERYSYWGKRALITGGGPVGLVIALLLKHHGWEVELCEIRNRRRQFANSFGIKTYSIINEVPEHNYTVVIDCTGEDPVIPHTFGEQVNKVTKGGAIILVGVYFSEISFTPLSHLSGEIEIVPSFLYTLKEIPALRESMHALAKPLKKMTQRIPFENLVNTLLEIEMNKDNFFKVALYNADH